MIEARNGKDHWKVSIDSARSHFDQGFRELARAAGQAKSEGREVWYRAQQRAQETWQDVRARGLSTWEEACEHGEEVLRTAEQYVRKNPARAVGLAALAGVVLGVLWGSGRRRE